MKFIKGLSLTLVAILAIYLLLAIFLPSTYSVSRELTIDAPAATVWNQISDFKKWENWSAWSEMDSTIKNTYKGTDGELGSTSSWTSDNSGDGQMTLTKSVENERFEYDLEFTAPWQSKSKGYVALEQMEGKTKATFCDEGPVPFLMRPMNYFGNMFDGMMGPQFEKGLENISKLAMASPVSSAKPMEISQTDFPATTYLGVRQNTTMAEVMTQEFYSSNFMKLGMALGENKLEMTGHPSAVFYAWNEEDSTAEVLPAFPVAAGSKVSTEGMEIVDIPAGKVVKAAYYGPYEGGAGAHKKIGEYCKANNIKTGLTIEEYANDPTTVASPDEILTNIYYFIIEE